MSDIIFYLLIMMSLVMACTQDETKKEKPKTNAKAANVALSVGPYGLPVAASTAMFTVSSIHLAATLPPTEETTLRKELERDLKSCDAKGFTNGKSIKLKLNLRSGIVTKPDFSSTGLTRAQQACLSDALWKKRFSVKYTGDINIKIKAKH